MKYNWEDIKWIFEPDGTLRDIYVLDVSIDDWKKLIDFLNENFNLKFGLIDQNQVVNKIDKDYAIKYLNDSTGELESKTISIILDQILINCHLFSDSEIEFDIDPNEITCEKELDKVLYFMKQLSEMLDKTIILTGENQSNFPLITIDKSSGIYNLLTKSEAMKKWNS